MSAAAPYALPPDVRESFDRDGFVVLRGFVTAAECDEMMSAMASLVDGWEPSSTVSVFETDSKQELAQGSDEYFLSSGDKVRFFLEPGAHDPKTNALRDGIAKTEALNKVGHALHVEQPVFRAYAQSEKVRAAARSVGLKDPDLPQSMYIFKQPRIGGEVTPHQDSAFLRTDPPTCVGLWLALQPATEANGCLWARPGSHTEPLRRHFRREKRGGGEGGERTVFDALVSEDECGAVAWDGKPLKRSPAELGFVPVPAEAGDLVVLHGQVDHLSMPNTSAHSRHSFQLHLVEGCEAGARWYPDNWLRYPTGKSFPKFD